MSDVRALLKAKRQEARVTHPLASYSASGQLRCSACAIPVKHASAWEGHLGSKAHRTAVARLRELERAKAVEEEQKAAQGKRRVDEDDGSESDGPTETKRRKVASGDEEEDEHTPAAGGGFPSDFFSDSARAPPPHPDSGDEVEEAAPAPAPAKGTDALEDEWAQFQQAVINAPEVRETYERATIMAEPVLAETTEGMPSAQDEAPPPQLDEEALRRRKEQDDRELIMDRLLEEERAQEEADMKVTVMKNRLEALKKKREAAKAAKAAAN